ncbi:MAG TPA: RIO1 family regulatory kinase/ATPase [Thermoplasmata archaeon]|nr:RIO1 family regulatory kinase/ATPase [Thermoplasmata archaeon]
MPRPEEVVFPGRERFEDRRRDADQRKLLDEFFDHATLLAVHRLVHRGLFETIDYPISTGKEGGVFRATAADGFRAVKIYRVGNTTFRNLPPYAVEELRREASARNYGGLVFAWTRREHTILTRLAEAGVRAPRPYGHFRNVLAMEYIGTIEGAAPRLKDAVIDDPAALYAELVREIGTMVRTARLVHGDLSPFNTLFFEDHVVLIDVAQSVGADHPAARALLERDIGHFARFLTRRGYPVSAEQFFADVGGDTVVPPARAEA